MNYAGWILGVGVVLIIIAALLSFQGKPSAPASPSISIDTNLQTNNNNIVNTVNTVPPAESAQEVTLQTSMGDITVHLYADAAPKTVENFLKLSREGFYNGVKFHRVIKGFMNQTGDPLSKDDSQMSRWGTGGPGYQFADEIDAQSALYQKGYKIGVVAMANAGVNTNGSQFFIMAADYPLPPSYTIFGEVTSGLDVVKKINEVKTDSNDRPLEPVIVKSVEVR